MLWKLWGEVQTGVRQANRQNGTNPRPYPHLLALLVLGTEISNSPVKLLLGIIIFFIIIIIIIIIIIHNKKSNSHNWIFLKSFKF